MESFKKRVEQRGEGGFTLIELLVVIAILAILAGVVVFAVGNSTKNAKSSACKTERSSIITAWAAAKAANEVEGNTETYANYLQTTTFKYFAAPTSAGAARTNVAAVDTTACAAVADADLAD